jgi:hypothetical protein
VAKSDNHESTGKAPAFFWKNMEKKTKNTIFLVGILLVFSVIGLIVQKLKVSDSGKVVVVTVNGYRTATLDLDHDAEKIIGDKEHGDYNIVQVKDGKARVSEANCSNQVCVLTGEISKEGEIIACLPHGVLVYIEDREEEAP